MIMIIRRLELDCRVDRIVAWSGQREGHQLVATIVENLLRHFQGITPTELWVTLDMDRPLPDVGDQPVELQQQPTITLVGHKAVQGIYRVSNGPHVNLEVCGTQRVRNEIRVVGESARQRRPGQQYDCGPNTQHHHAGSPERREGPSNRRHRR